MQEGDEAMDEQNIKELCWIGYPRNNKLFWQALEVACRVRANPSEPIIVHFRGGASVRVSPPRNAVAACSRHEFG
jgi:hypothetical protein